MKIEDVKKINVVYVKEPKIPQEVLKLASSLEEQLPYTENIIIVEKFKDKRLEVFPVDFSVYLASNFLGINLGKPLGVGGILNTTGKWILTDQTPIQYTFREGYVYSRPAAVTISFKGFAKDIQIDQHFILDNIYYEMEEELGIYPEHLQEQEIFFAEGEFLFFLLKAKVNLTLNEVEACRNAALDGWEARKLFLASEDEICKLALEFPPYIKEALKVAGII